MLDGCRISLRSGLASVVSYGGEFIRLVVSDASPAEAVAGDLDVDEAVFSRKTVGATAFDASQHPPLPALISAALLRASVR
jgi:hypothetical protein